MIAKMDEYFKKEHLFYYVSGAAIIVVILKLIFFIRLDCNLILKFYDTFWRNKKKLNGKVVWIVGSSTGIGEELAYQFAKLNCKLILTSTNESKLQQVQQQCLEISKGKLTYDDILVLAYDISNLPKNDEAFNRLIEKFGQLDILVCNAAKASSSVIMEEETEAVRNLFNTNFFSHVHIAKIVLRYWFASKAKNADTKLNKQILVTSSTVSIVEMPFASTYTATKQALNAFFHDVAMQYQPDGVYVTIALPGPVESQLVNNSYTQGNRKFNDKNLTKMSTKRCAHLMIVSLANKLHETYISNQPFLTITYLYSSFGFYIMYLIRTFGLRNSIEKQFFAKQ